MNHETELKLQAWVDGELPPKEARHVRTLVESNAETRALAEELRHTRTTLRSGEPERSVPVTREFFWSGIECAILATEHRDPALRLPRIPLFWLRWLLPIGAAAALALLLFLPDTPRVSDTSQFQIATEIESPLPDVSSFTFRSEADNMTVVWIGRE